ncbi:MAG TPA: non-homologous end-joining DNA ligase [Thermoanaerobaculia bacterium]|nr:non-homologous end-joining DNA ligase [Thermoanaerobaculia bacterium]
MKRHPAPRRASAAKLPRRAAPRARRSAAIPEIPSGRDEAEVAVGRRRVRLTNLRKAFWPELGVTKGDLLRYYAAISPWLLPHVADRAMVMKRYPHGAGGEYFFMKRAPFPRPEWIRTCAIEHASGSVIDFPVVDDLAALLWVVNLGCIDLNPWYARCDDVNRPDWVHFDLDPVKGGSFAQVSETALAVARALRALGMPCFAKTTGSRGIHVYVPIVRGPTQKEVWGFAKRFAQEIASRRPDLATAEYRIAKRPARRVLVDYNQNAWGRTLASIYSVRPSPRAGVSTPVTWEEIERGIAIEDFRIDNVAARVGRLGDLWAPLLSKKGRFDLSEYL